MKKLINVQLIAVLTFAATMAVPVAKADHHGHYDITCVTRNARGQRFQATGYSEFPRDNRVWSDLQQEANEDCRHSGSLVCIPLGCTEFFHHEH